ncbi:hypothetical protein [Shigella boydii]
MKKSIPDFVFFILLKYPAGLALSNRCPAGFIRTEKPDDDTSDHINPFLLKQASPWILADFREGANKSLI